MTKPPPAVSLPDRFEHRPGTINVPEHQGYSERSSRGAVTSSLTAKNEFDHLGSLEFRAASARGCSSGASSPAPIRSTKFNRASSPAYGGNLRTVPSFCGMSSNSSSAWRSRQRSLLFILVSPGSCSLLAYDALSIPLCGRTGALPFPSQNLVLAEEVAQERAVFFNHAVHLRIRNIA